MNSTYLLLNSNNLTRLNAMAPRVTGHLSAGHFRRLVADHEATD
jgi:hypothetical protein